MTSLRFIALDSDLARAWRRGEADANGQAPERQISDGDGNTCRHCLDDIAAGDPFLVLAHRPCQRFCRRFSTGSQFRIERG